MERSLLLFKGEEFYRIRLFRCDLHFLLLLFFTFINVCCLELKNKRCDSVVILFQLIMGFNLLTVGIAGWKLFVKKTRAI